MIFNKTRRLFGPDDGESGASGTDTLDRGDEFTPTDPEETTVDEVKKPDTPALETPASDDKEVKKDNRIPLARHKEILDRERNIRADLEKQVENLKRGAAVSVTNEEITKLEDKVTSMEAEYNKALADGEIDKATKLMGQIRAAERQIGDSRGEMRSQVAEARAYERVRYDNTVDRLEAAFPQLVEGNDDYDDEATKEVLELRDAYQLKGYAPADALQKAAKMVLGASTGRQQKAVDTDVRVDKADLAKATAEERKKDAVARNLKVAGKAAPDLKNVGIDSDRAGGSLTARDVSKMPQEAFAKLSEKDIARLRGDDL